MTTPAQVRSTLESWYQQQGAALLLFGIALTGDRARAQDAVHQIFLRLLNSPDLSHIADARTYLFRALRNALTSDFRRRSHDLPLLQDEPWFDTPAPNYADELSLRRALAALPEDQREVTVLHIWGGLTFAEAAEVLGINPNTAAARYRYALAKLRDTLSPAKGTIIDERR